MAATRKAITLGSQWVSVLDSGVTLGESEWRAVTSLAHMAGNGTSFLALPVERDPFVDYSPSYVARDELIVCHHTLIIKSCLLHISFFLSE